MSKIRCLSLFCTLCVFVFSDNLTVTQLQQSEVWVALWLQTCSSIASILYDIVDPA